MSWKSKKVLVTGGASFISSHLVEKLLSLGASVRVADDLSSGKKKNLKDCMDDIEFMKGNLKDTKFARKAVKGMDAVFHMAAAHGGRGYIHTHPADCASNMALDGIVFEAAHQAEVERVCFASSACVYPGYLQEAEGSNYLLKETDADAFERDKAMADLEYGWAKLMGEVALRAYHRQYGMKTSCVRIFTAYGPRENESHAIVALIAKAFIKMDPFEIWGTGEQDRNFTYVSDIVDGLVLAAETIEDGSPLNAGRDDRITINQTAEILFNITGWRPKEIFHDTTKPTGVASRAADLTKARSLGYEVKVGYEDGFKRTLEWYFNSHKKSKVEERFAALLMER